MGGVPMVAAALLAFGCWALLAAGEVFSLKGLPSSILFAFTMSVLGFWDDLSGLSPLARFLCQLIAAILFLWAWTGLFHKIPLGGVTLPPLLWILTGAIWIVWMVNLYNFMDGIDGLAGGEAAVASSFFFLLFARYGESGWAVANLFVAAASMGFLVHNWPPARVFMGDAGSAFLGAFFGMQSVVASLATPVPFLVLVLPFTNFILDTTVTLLRRMVRGEKWYLSHRSHHRSHYYQRMTNLGMSHKKVTVIELLFAIGSCIAASAYLWVDGVGRLIPTAVLLSAFLSYGIRICTKEREEGSFHT
jgi:UDP-N-acetylmuramyl pentapeptide phosphotransferase/UDP-N-acetylglucosamine-1-phosphate transferase